MSLKNKNILVGVTGGIAAYKTIRVIRKLIREKAKIRVIMTNSACKFIQPLTFEVVSQNQVYTEIFPETREYNVLHVSLVDWADMLLIAPATGNIIGKIAGGIADDLLSTVVMACPVPKILAPAMETNMWNNPIVKANIKKLKSFSYNFIQPGKGVLASGASGAGRMAEPEDIIQVLKGYIK
jgi:phosphopantothenoylcysteine decarboxylase/phosphopantothenate--cysteine ligase